MSSYTVKLSAVAYMKGYARVEADSEEAARELALSSEVLSDVSWEYDGLDEDEEILVQEVWK